MEEEYLILECPACERNLKVKAETAGTKMGCPYCKEPIDIIDERTAVENEEETEAEPPKPLNFRKMEPGTAPPETTSEPQTAEHSHSSDQNRSSGTGERRKHRKRHAETLDWDEEKKLSADGEEISEATADDDDTAEYLEMDPNAPGEVRLKRVRRKKVLTGKDKFVRGVTVAVFVAAAALAALILYAAVFQTAKVVGTDDKIKREIAEDVRIAIEEAKANPDPITEDLTSSDENLAVATLTAFLNAKTIEDRLLYVRNPEKTRPMMEQWYAENPEEAEKEWPDANVIRRKKITDQNRYFIILAVDFVGSDIRYLALEQRAKDDMKLDWPTTVGYQPIPIEKFKEVQPKTPTQFWVKIKPSDFYSFSFTKEKYQAVELSYPGKVEFKLIGYVDRTKQWAPPLLTMLDNGQAPSLIVDLQYPAGEIKDNSQVEITSLIATTWWP